MSSLVQGLDTITNRNRGENGQYQENWTHAASSMEERITSLFYQLVRVDKKSGQRKLDALCNLYSELVSSAVDSANQSQINILVSLLFQTRDICGGKGEYALFYELLPVWDQYMSNDQVSKVLKPMLVLLLDKDVANTAYGLEQGHSYGSWKDFKYVLEKFRTSRNLTPSEAVRHISESPIAAYFIEVALSVLTSVSSGEQKDCLIARWLPREKSKYGWQAKLLADGFAKRRGGNYSVEAALREYRRTLSRLNKELGTVQINQCAGTWANIDFDKECTSITMARQKKAFVCEGRNTSASESEDRVNCKENFMRYIDECKTGGKKIKSARTSPGDMVKEFWIQYTSSRCGTNILTQVQKDTSNLMWKQQQENHGSALANCVPILDTSASMTWENCPLYDATAIALKIAENSTIGKRVMTFSETPTWINLEGKDTLEEMVNGIVKMSHSVGMSTNMQAAFQLLCNACVHKNMTPEEVEDIVLVVLSDMQADQGAKSSGKDTLEDIVQEMFHEAGLKTSHKRPYAAPTMVWWNMRTTNGAPCATTSKNTVMMSGYDASVLSTVMESGIDTLKQMTAWDNLRKILSKERYSWAWELASR